MKRASRKIDKQAADSKPAGAEPSAEAAFASYAAPLVDDAIELANAVREDASPEALHKLRVSLRRLRSLWWAFEPLLDKGENTRQRALYKYLATAAGKTRDWDILIELIAQDERIAHEITPTLQAARSGALATSRETLSNADVKHLLQDALTSANKELNTARERVPLQKFADKRVTASERSLNKRIKRASQAKRSNYAAFHDVRKAGKKVRYLLEFFEPILSVSHKRVLKRLKQIQKRFGTLNDIVASEMLLRDNMSLLAGSGDTDATLDWLKKERKRRMRAAAGLLRKL
ncbi:MULTISPECIES: CHAD domain-containing protein [Paraburkholderia]|uniref:CHAD domain-containing protein n=1 Tax=Paraburkholderia madseniana TaxID=2599607 RepID=A0AAP5B813_9BURK|nr:MULTISPECIES: CHAD domain-containing protein [Paraburkholderia]MCX4144866.1 CHAD domain-containing protein [Paraburkholderia madseniana]MCX4176491.1 CHAD domain-containing protein [Paraburkholderia madseniana]MDN7147818.1 CHAD domain-containing protein [Paraburkholderia sp. WS6]MDQ6406698.1 CHAD domain-containing protein [Paraburkholderia madseniana]MDQ6464483.1 CHAD domain-containing protein [Paraburkholderia madseniana]